VIKIVKLIKLGNIDKATDAIRKALILSITKHHIQLIANMMEAALNTRPSPSSSDHTFLLPVPSLEVTESQDEDFSIQELID
jgi:hypothetical protein